MSLMKLLFPQDDFKAPVQPAEKNFKEKVAFLQKNIIPMVKHLPCVMYENIDVGASVYINLIPDLAPDYIKKMEEENKHRVAWAWDELGWLISEPNIICGLLTDEAYLKKLEGIRLKRVIRETEEELKGELK